jgi:hypothetical protein
MKEYKPLSWVDLVSLIICWLITEVVVYNLYRWYLIRIRKIGNPYIDTFRETNDTPKRNR